MKNIFTFVGCCLLTNVTIAQSDSPKSSRWLTTVEMGVLAGRVRPDNPYNNGSYGYYPTSSLPLRPAGNRIGLTIHAFTGYLVRNQLAAGLAYGVDYYNNSAFIPVAAAVQGNFLRSQRRISPYYSLESGYAFRGPNPHETELKGGWLWSTGLGIRINKGNGTGFQISAGYRHQRAKQIASVDGVQTLSQVEYRHYNRLYFRMGFSF